MNSGRAKPDVLAKSVGVKALNARKMTAAARRAHNSAGNNVKAERSLKPSLAAAGLQNRPAADGRPATRENTKVLG